MIIALEGIDGSGKTKILNKLENIYSENKNIIFIHTPISPFKEIRGFFNKETNLLESFMFYHASNIYLIKKMEDFNQKIIVLDRFVFSTYVAHAAWEYEDLNNLMLKILKKFKPYFPNKTFLIKISPNIQIERLSARITLADEEKIMLDLKKNKKIYDWYYEKSFKKLESIGYSGIEILDNDFQSDFENNIKILSDFINRYLVKLDLK